MFPATLVDRRARPSWDDRRNDLGQLPSGRATTSRIVRNRHGRRAADRVDAPRAHPHPSMLAPTITGATGFIEPDGPLYMPSGQRIA